jgi:hydrogenase maturation factor
MGKLSTNDLRKLLSCVKKDPRVIVPPLPGFDSGVHLIDDDYLVVSTDPCIGVPEEWFGWLLIHYAASDVALFGAKPEFCTINLLGPLSTKPQLFRKIMMQTCNAADELGMAIVTGHTGTYEGLSAPVGVCTAYGKVDKDKLITPSGAKHGDYIFCIKSVGLETAINFALTRKVLAEELFGPQHVKELAELTHLQSCVKEALLLTETGGVHAMHDATEGGFVVALNEMAEASKAGFRIKLEKIPVAKEAQTLQKYFRLSEEQLLSMSSTGTILAAVSPENKGRIEEALHQNNVETCVLGVFTKNLKRILVEREREMLFPRKADDPYRRILSGRL